MVRHQHGERSTLGSREGVLCSLCSRSLSYQQLLVPKAFDSQTDNPIIVISYMMVIVTLIVIR